MTRFLYNSITTITTLALTAAPVVASSAAGAPTGGEQTDPVLEDIPVELVLACSSFAQFDGQTPSEALAEEIAAAEGEALLTWDRCECDTGGYIHGCLQVAVGDEERFDNLVLTDDACELGDGCANSYAGYTLMAREEYTRTYFDYDTTTVWVSFDIDYYIAQDDDSPGVVDGLWSLDVAGPGRTEATSRMGYAGYGTLEQELDYTSSWTSWVAYDASGIEVDSDVVFEIAATYDEGHESRCELSADYFATVASTGIEAVAAGLTIAALEASAGAAAALLGKFATAGGLAGTAVGEWGAAVYELAFCFDEYGEIGEAGYWVNCSDGAASLCENQSGWHDFEIQDSGRCITGEVFVQYSYNEADCSCEYRYLSTRNLDTYEGACGSVAGGSDEAETQTPSGF